MNEFEPLNHKLFPIITKINEDIWEKIPSSFWNKVKFSTEVKVKNRGVGHILIVLADETIHSLIDIYT